MFRTHFRPAMSPKKRSKKKKNASSGSEKPQERAFSWYPGHMVKAKRELENNLKLSDAVLLMLDARAPLSTRHEELELILKNRSSPFVLVLNKSDLAEEEQTLRWRSQLKAEGHLVVEMSALKGRGTGPLTPLLKELEDQINEKRAAKGLLPREPRLMVAGLPNSGKSTLLNRLVGKTRFKAGKKPGLTRGAQWVKVAGRYLLLDTPGILYPRIEGDQALAYLAAIGSVRRDVLPQQKVARTLLNELEQRNRLAELLPDLDLGEDATWRTTPLMGLAELWGFDSDSDQRQAFERFLNQFTKKSFRITWQRVP